jgi:hypothetical protein
MMHLPKMPFVDGGVRRPLLFAYGQSSVSPPMMPLDATDDRLISVDRSWIALDATDDRLVTVKTPRTYTQSS